MRAGWIAALLVGVVGCGKDAANARPAATTEATASASASAGAGAAAAAADEVVAPACDLPARPWKLPAPARLVAIGDLHGDLDATRRVLALAGAIDDQDRWIGGDLVVVQTGDILDRGDGEEAILELLARLSGEADKAGGALIQLNGNHELMNAAGDLRYVTPGGFADFGGEEARVAAFAPGGPWAKRLADKLTVVMVGDTVFAHGGVEPKWAGRVDEINGGIRCWLDGATAVPDAEGDPDGPVWSRDYSAGEADCDGLRASLATLGARRMVVGHTPQEQGVTSACDDLVWRIDVGLAAHYGGPTEALQIVGDEVTILGRKE